MAGEAELSTNVGAAPPWGVFASRVMSAIVAFDRGVGDRMCRKTVETVHQMLLSAVALGYRSQPEHAGWMPAIALIKLSGSGKVGQVKTPAGAEAGGAVDESKLDDASLAACAADPSVLQTAPEFVRATEILHSLLSNAARCILDDHFYFVDGNKPSQQRRFAQCVRSMVNLWPALKQSASHPLDLPDELQAVGFHEQVVRLSDLTECVTATQFRCTETTCAWLLLQLARSLLQCKALLGDASHAGVCSALVSALRQLVGHMTAFEWSDVAGVGFVLLSSFVGIEWPFESMPTTLFSVQSSAALIPILAPMPDAFGDAAEMTYLEISEAKSTGIHPEQIVHLRKLVDSMKTLFVGKAAAAEAAAAVAKTVAAPVEGDTTRVFDDQIAQLLLSAAEDPRAVASRSIILQIVEALVQEEVKAPVQVALFGSSASTLSLPSSDLDVCVSTNATISVSGLHRLGRALIRKGFTTEVIAHARVPVIKFADRARKWEGDICINNNLALHNTRMLRTYAEIEPRVRELVLALKRIAKNKKVNDASQGTLSSYSYALMVIYFCQVHQPPLVPSLQSPELFEVYKSETGKEPFTTKVDVYTATFIDDVAWVKSYMQRCMAPANTQSSGELLQQLLHFYSHRFQWRDHAVSPRLGKFPVPKLAVDKQPMPWRLAVEDPFELRNLGRVLTAAGGAAVRDMFKNAWADCKKPRVAQTLLDISVASDILTPITVAMSDPAVAAVADVDVASEADDSFLRPVGGESEDSNRVAGKPKRQRAPRAPRPPKTADGDGNPVGVKPPRPPRLPKPVRRAMAAAAAAATASVGDGAAGSATAAGGGGGAPAADARPPRRVRPSRRDGRVPPNASSNDANWRSHSAAPPPPPVA